MSPELEVMDHVRAHGRTWHGALLHLMAVGLPVAFCVNAALTRVAATVAGKVSLWSFASDAGLLAGLVAVFAARAWFNARCYEFAVDRAAGRGDQVFRAFNALFGRKGASHFDLIHQAAVEDARERLLARRDVEPRTNWGRVMTVRPQWLWIGGGAVSRDEAVMTVHGQIWPERLKQSRFYVTYAGGDVAGEPVYQDALLDLLLACGQDLDPTSAELVYPHYLGLRARIKPRDRGEHAALSSAWELAAN